MDSTAVDRIAQLGVEAANANILNTRTSAVILTARDGSQTITSLEHLESGRARYRGKFATPYLQAFADYVVRNRENDSTGPQPQGFINTDTMQATVFFNLGDREDPGHADYTANLKLQQTAAFTALNRHTGTTLDQRGLHDFIEDWRDNIAVLYNGAADTSKPLSAALAAIRDISIDTARSINSVERDMGATRSAMESVDAKSKHTLPSGFQFRCVPYDGLQERTFNLRLGVNTGSDKLSLVLRIQQAEATTEAIAKDFADRLGALLGTASTLTLGTFTP
ncbi:MAG: DUF2303 family protein [Rhodanobacter sp.]